MAKSQTFQKNYIRCGSRVVGLWNVGVGFRYCIDIFGANHCKWHTINLNYAILLFLRFELFEKSLRKFYSKLVFVMISKTINLFYVKVAYSTIQKLILYIKIYIYLYTIFIILVICNSNCTNFITDVF